MRNDFGTRPYKSRFPYSKDTKGKRVKAKQGYYAREDESIGMRLGKGKATAAHPKKPLQNEIYLMETGANVKKTGRRHNAWKRN